MSNEASDDDDFEQPQNKIPKLDLDESTDGLENCIICFTPWTTNGDHRMVSIKCGHFFGRKCIERWCNEKGRSATCPMCNLNFSKNDIRSHFICLKSVKILDNHELNDALSTIEKHTKQLNDLQEQNSCLTLNNQMYKIEVENLKQENSLYKEKYDNIKTEFLVNQESTTQQLKPLILKKILRLSNNGNCRVLAYSKVNEQLAASCPSPCDLFNSYGVRFVDVNQMRLLKVQMLHSQEIRQIAFDTLYHSNMMLTCSFDSKVKMSNIHSGSIVFTSDLPLPVWSVCWSSNIHQFYAGCANGNVYLVDKRKPSSPVCKLWNKPGGPVFSIQHLVNNKHFDESGILVSNAQGIVFLPKSSTSEVINTNNISSSQSFNENCVVDYDTVLLSKNYKGGLMSTSFNERSAHIFSTFRPSNPTSRMKLLLSELGRCPITNKSAAGTTNQRSESLYANSIREYECGSNSTQFMIKSCFVNNAENIYMACPNESASSIDIFDANSTNPIMKLHPRHINPQQPILDVCQIDSAALDSVSERDPSPGVMLAAVNSHNLYLYNNLI